MIPENFVQHWFAQAPWQSPSMIEQDLVISRALICLYNHPKISTSLAFRGGTALNKLYIKPASRYSEDIDLVQIQPEPIGETVKAIRSVLDDWLGFPKSKLTQRSAKLIYVFESVDGITSRLKLEINTTEHFHLSPLKFISHDIESPWYSGKADILTYKLEELMATKLCALYQRSKGRDLFDLWLVHHLGLIDSASVISIFQEFCTRTNAHITRALFEKNLAEKYDRKDYRSDIIPLLGNDTKWDFDAAYNSVLIEFASRLPGAPWKGYNSG